MNSESLSDISKFLSYVLRHEPQAIGLQLDSDGWVNLDALIAGAAASGRRLDIDTIRAVVAGSDKKRFSLSDDGRRIRAVQGHSTTQVQLQHVQKRPPERLYLVRPAVSWKPSKPRGWSPGRATTCTCRRTVSYTHLTLPTTPYV